MDFAAYDRRMSHKSEKLAVAKRFGCSNISEAYLYLASHDYTTAEIGELFSVTVANVRYYLRKMGFKSNPHGGKRTKTERAFKTVDSNLKKSIDILISFAKSKKHKYFSEYVFTSLKKMTLKSLQAEIADGGVYPVPSLSRLNAVKQSVLRELGDNKAKAGDRICCVEGCNNKVPPENHRFCRDCFEANKKKSTYFDMAHRCLYV